MHMNSFEGLGSGVQGSGEVWGLFYIGLGDHTFPQPKRPLTPKGLLLRT